MIPNFIDFTKHLHHSEECQRNLIASDNQHIITHISNFRKVKRIDDVIDIFYRIQDEVNAILMMVGDGPERLNAMTTCEKLGIGIK